MLDHRGGRARELHRDVGAFAGSEATCGASAASLNAIVAESTGSERDCCSVDVTADFRVFRAFFT